MKEQRYKKIYKKKTGYDVILELLEWYIGGALAFTFFLRSIFFLGSCFSIVLTYICILIINERNDLKKTEKLMFTGITTGLIGFLSIFLYGFFSQFFINGYNLAMIINYISILIVGFFHVKRSKQKSRWRLKWESGKHSKHI